MKKNSVLACFTMFLTLSAFAQSTKIIGLKGSTLTKVNLQNGNETTVKDIRRRNTAHRTLTSHAFDPVENTFIFGRSSFNGNTGRPNGYVIESFDASTGKKVHRFALEGDGNQKGSFDTDPSSRTFYSVTSNIKSSRRDAKVVFSKTNMDTGKRKIVTQLNREFPDITFSTQTLYHKKRNSVFTQVFSNATSLVIEIDAKTGKTRRNISGKLRKLFSAQTRLLFTYNKATGIVYIGGASSSDARTENIFKIAAYNPSTNTVSEVFSSINTAPQLGLDTTIQDMHYDASNNRILVASTKNSNSDSSQITALNGIASIALSTRNYQDIVTPQLDGFSGFALISGSKARIASKKALTDVTNTFANDFRIYPNPSSDIINIAYTITKGATVYFNLIDVTGRIIEHKTFSHTESNLGMSFNVAKLPKGTYFLEAIENANTKVSKFIVK